MIIGSHVPMSLEKQLLGSVEVALSNGANAMMVYTGAPQNTVRNTLDKKLTEKAHFLASKNGFSIANIVIHAPYIVNLANPREDVRNFSIDFITKEIERTELLGSTIFVLHPGMHLGYGVDSAVSYIGLGIRKIIENTKDSNVTICMESMAGKGTEIGKTLEELSKILQNVDNRKRMGICLDTCHLHDAGYDLTDFNNLLDNISQNIGIDYLKLIHLNDSKNISGSHKDRHENIGFGEIGFETLYSILKNERISKIPKILETPYVKSEKDPKKSYSPYKREISMLKAGVFDPYLRENIIRDNEEV